MSWQDEALLSDWKQQLDRDIETLKSQANIVSIRTVSCSLNLNHQFCNVELFASPCVFFVFWNITAAVSFELE